MPIYYKKVNPDSADLNLVESGLGSTGNTGFFSFGNVPKKLSNNFSGSRSSFPTSDVELEKISCSFDNQDVQDHTEFLTSKTVNGDRERLMTKFGPIVVVKQFPTNLNESITTSEPPPPRPVIITYHDIGLNYFSNFESFFTRLNVKQLLQDFRIYHLNAPGQEENAEDLPPNYLFPTIDQLTEQLGEVCRYYNIQQFIGFGYGAGANVLSRFALQNPDLVEALFLINPSATTSTWAEWFYQKLNLRAMYNPPVANGQTNGTIVSNMNLPLSVQNYFMWHLFGNVDVPDRVVDEESMTFYRRYFDSGAINKYNLSKFIESYIARTALGITREDRLNNFKCSVAVLCGDYSPHVDESIKMNGRLDPTNSTWMKLSDCSMVLEEQPNKVTEVLRLFLQGLGYTLKKALRQDRAFINGKSMPCLAFYNRINNSNGHHHQQEQEQPATITATSTPNGEYRRSTLAGLNQV